VSVSGFSTCRNNRVERLELGIARVSVAPLGLVCILRSLPTASAPSANSGLYSFAASVLLQISRDFVR
jgi:hypothetical protein